MIRLLLALCPRAWRRSYGEEFAALLEQTRLTPGVVLDVLVQVVRLQVGARRTRFWVEAALLVSVGVELTARETGRAVNIVWLPHTQGQAVALVALAAPWVAVATQAVRARSLRRRVTS